MSNVHDYVGTAQAALAEAFERIPAAVEWDYDAPDATGRQLADIERSRLAQTRAITNAILSVAAELHVNNTIGALMTGVVRLGTPAGGAIRAEILEHLGITTTAKES